MIKIIFALLLAFKLIFVEGIQPCSTLITSQANTTLIATESPSNNCQYDALFGGGFGLTGEMTFGLPIEPGTTSPNYFKIMNINIENIDGLTINLMFGTNATSLLHSLILLLCIWGKFHRRHLRPFMITWCSVPCLKRM